MSRARRFQKQQTRFKITVHLDDEMASMVDQWQNQFGLDSRSDAFVAMA